MNESDIRESRIKPTEEDRKKFLAGEKNLSGILQKHAKGNIEEIYSNWFNAGGSEQQLAHQIAEAGIPKHLAESAARLAGQRMAEAGHAKAEAPNKEMEAVKSQKTNTMIGAPRLAVFIGLLCTGLWIGYVFFAPDCFVIQGGGLNMLFGGAVSFLLPFGLIRGIACVFGRFRRNKPIQSTPRKESEPVERQKIKVLISQHFGSVIIAAALVISALIALVAVIHHDATLRKNTPYTAEERELMDFKPTPLTPLGQKHKRVKLQDLLK